MTALQGQQFLIITMSVTAPRNTHSKLMQAAAKAGIPYVMPNCYGTDFTNESLSKAMLTGDEVRAGCAEIEATGVSSWIALACSLWYEYSLVSGPEWFGFDFKEKKLTFYDNGDTKINVSRWEQCGRAVAALLSLKELPEDENDQSATVSSWRNKPLYISSFLLSQKDMLESWKRVTGEKDEDWTIDYEPTAERYKRRAVFAWVFYPNGDGDYEHEHGLANTSLGLPKEDLDARTKVAKEMIERGYSYFARDGSK